MTSTANIFQDAKTRFAGLLRQRRRQVYLYYSCYGLAGIITSLIVVWRWQLTPAYGAGLTLAMVLLTLLAMSRSREFASLTETHLAEHLNTRFVSLEQSSQLLITPVEKLNRLNCLQQARMNLELARLLSNNEKVFPSYQWHRPLLLVCSLSVFAYISPWFLVVTQHVEDTPVNVELGQVPNSESNANRLVDAEVLIIPPAYTGLSEQRQSELDIQAIEGSHVTWRLEVKDNRSSIYLNLDGERLALSSTEGTLLQVSKEAKNTSVYYFTEEHAENSVRFADIYAIEVIRDRAPTIRFVDTSGENKTFAKNQLPIFTTEVVVTDDFAVAEVEILASVAKGSGEAVKFRDQTLQFQQRSLIEAGTMLSRAWDLVELGMEPGDELYFTVIATDNKQPSPNQTKSRTVIVRWSDDEVASIAADGMVIDFQPEYFKSQRQIIIETEQLIKDQNVLTEQEFMTRSNSLGQAQADLKNKYGQYLGDEFSGSELHTMTAAESEIPSSASEHNDDHHDHHGHNETKTGGPMASLQAGDKSGLAQMYERFGHDHGKADIGPITKHNPVGLMKRAIGEMWQAELHLSLGQPDLALPYEYEAYKYVKLAKQAERIYVKRLGFEPPPVSEKTRLTGDIENVSNKRIETTISQDPSDLSVLINQSLELLTTSTHTKLTNQQLTLLAELSQRLTAVAQQQTGLITHIATLEKIRLAAQTNLAECDNCVNELIANLWRLNQVHAIAPFDFRTRINKTNPLIESYERRRMGEGDNQ